MSDFMVLLREMVFFQIGNELLLRKARQSDSPGLRSASEDRTQICPLLSNLDDDKLNIYMGTL